MAPGIIADSYEGQSPVLRQKANGNGALNGAMSPNVREDYEGNYQFAPIEEAQVSRAMIKRRVFDCPTHRCKSI
jgi:cysteine-dependent adenosine diphosphate thiazole synthase